MILSKTTQFRELESFQFFAVASRSFMPFGLLTVKRVRDDSIVDEHKLLNFSFPVDSKRVEKCRLIAVYCLEQNQYFLTLITHDQYAEMCGEYQTHQFQKLYQKTFMVSSNSSTDKPDIRIDKIESRHFKVPRSLNWQRENVTIASTYSLDGESYKHLLETSQQELENWDGYRFCIDRHANRFPTGYRNRKEDRPDKGKLGGACNVNACQLEGQAFFYNRHMHAFYCWGCATEHHHSRTHKESQTYDPNIFDVCQNQSYTLTRAQIQRQRKCEWVTKET